MSDFIHPQATLASKLERVVAICTDPEFGISNCIRFNRDVFRVLQDNTPELFEMGRCPWVLLNGVDMFIFKM